ncbi:MAG: anhydro-N-acetylmuramic acid kinase [Psychromonas sp.]
MSQTLYIGVMSGTSLDGVDSALIGFEDSNITLIDHDFFAMPKDLKQDVLDMCMGQATTLKKVGKLDHKLGHLFAAAVKQLLAKTNHAAKQITAIGSHGQTVYHQPTGDSPFTMQIGDANIIASETGITTIADFRRKDMALGGQGAPLVPAFHSIVFPVQESTCVVLNIGGIANISVLRKDQPVIGYDTGPGNMLMDAWIEKHSGKKYDKDASFALTGKVHDGLLKLLLSDPYFLLPAPKSTGRELFNLPWLETKLTQINTPISAQDVQATLARYTATSIANEVTKYRQGPKPELLLCGGGSHNPLLVSTLKTLLAVWDVKLTNEKGIDCDYMEAIAFAWLAQRRVNNLPSNLPDVTGASKLASLGVIYPAD